MQYFTGQSEHVVVLRKGENLLTCLRDVVSQIGIRTAWLQGLGAALELEIGYYDLDKKQYIWKTLEGAHEITGMQGNVVHDAHGEPIFHIHGTFSDTNNRAYGGHIKRLVVAGTCEVLLRPLSIGMTRQADELTGLNVLCDISSPERQ